MQVHSMLQCYEKDIILIGWHPGIQRVAIMNVHYHCTSLGQKWLLLGHTYNSLYNTMHLCMVITSTKAPRQNLNLSTYYGDIIMSAMASQITSLSVVYSTVYSGADQRKHQYSMSLAFVRGIHRGPVNSPHKWSVTRKMLLFDDVIMRNWPRNIESLWYYARKTFFMLFMSYFTPMV